MPEDVEAESTDAPLNISSLRPVDMSVSRDAEDRRHLISDDQLERLSGGGKDISLELALGLGGAAFGFLQNVVATCRAMFEPKLDHQPVDIILSMIFFACAAGAMAKFSEHRKNKTDIDELKKQIKSRPTVRVQ